MWRELPLLSRMLAEALVRGCHYPELSIKAGDEAEKAATPIADMMMKGLRTRLPPAPLLSKVLELEYQPDTITVKAKFISDSRIPYAEVLAYAAARRVGVPATYIDTLMVVEEVINSTAYTPPRRRSVLETLPLPHGGRGRELRYTWWIYVVYGYLRVPLGSREYWIARKQFGHIPDGVEFRPRIGYEMDEALLRRVEREFRNVQSKLSRAGLLPKIVAPTMEAYIDRTVRATRIDREALARLSLDIWSSVKTHLNAVATALYLLTNDLKLSAEALGVHIRTIKLSVAKYERTVGRSRLRGEGGGPANSSKQGRGNVGRSEAFLRAIHTPDGYSELAKRLERLERMIEDIAVRLPKQEAPQPRVAEKYEMDERVLEKSDVKASDSLPSYLRDNPWLEILARRASNI